MVKKCTCHPVYVSPSDDGSWAPHGDYIYMTLYSCPVHGERPYDQPIPGDPDYEEPKVEEDSGQ